MSAAVRFPRFAFAGDRRIAVRVLEYLLNGGWVPSALLLPEPAKASHADALRELAADLTPDRVFYGKAFRADSAVDLLRGLGLDYLLSVHFPLIIPAQILALPKRGALNLHPAYLPYNRGWHTPSWAILDETPYGASLHFVDEGVDTGDIVRRERIDVRPSDTADSLYARVLELEMDLFKAAWPSICDDSFQRFPQEAIQKPAAHKRGDLFRDSVQKLDLEQSVRTGDLLRRLRGLTTNNVEEAAYFEDDGLRYRVQVKITPEP